MRRLVLFAFVLFYSGQCFGNGFKAGFGVSTIAVSGGLKDYFDDDFAYRVDAQMHVADDSLGAVYLCSALQYFAIYSDDIRYSSRAKFYNLDFGVHQSVYSVAWFDLLLGLNAEFTLWTLKNQLSSSYRANDQGTFLGVVPSLVTSLRINEQFSLDAGYLTHLPQFSFHSTYYDLGVRVMRTW